MSLDYFVHFEKQRAISLEQWRAKIAALGYPLVLPDSVDPAGPEGATDCTFASKAVIVGFFLDENPELQSPFPNDRRSWVMQFNFSASAGENTQLAAVAAAASFCIATGGVIDDNGELIRSNKAKTWARRHVQEDDEMTKMALSHPHPDDVFPNKRPPSGRPWWRFW